MNFYLFFSNSYINRQDFYGADLTTKLFKYSFISKNGEIKKIELVTQNIVENILIIQDDFDIEKDEIILGCLKKFIEKIRENKAKFFVIFHETTTNLSMQKKLVLNLSNGIEYYHVVANHTEKSPYDDLRNFLTENIEKEQAFNKIGENIYDYCKDVEMSSLIEKYVNKSISISELEELRKLVFESQLKK